MEFIIYEPSLGYLGELGYLNTYKYFDMQLGGPGNKNDFVVTFDVNEVAEIRKGYYIMCAGTEYGGRFKKQESVTNDGSVTWSGITYRYILDHYFIFPTTVSGDATLVLQDLMSGGPPEFTVSEELTGIILEPYRFYYESFLHGIENMFLAAGLKLKIECIPPEQFGEPTVMLSAEPVVDYSDTIEYSQDSNINFRVTDDDGTTSLLVLGAGDEDERLYCCVTDFDGEIVVGGKEYLAPGDTEVLDTNEDDDEELAKAGIDRFREIMGGMSLEVTDFDVPFDPFIGDIIGGRDRVTGLFSREPIIEKVLHKDEANIDIEITYKTKGGS